MIDPFSVARSLPRAQLVTIRALVERAICEGWSIERTRAAIREG